MRTSFLIRTTRSLMHTVFYYLDWVRTVLSRPFFSWFTLVAFVLVAAYCIYTWLAQSGTPKDVGPNLAEAVIFMVIMFFVERLRKSR